MAKRPRSPKQPLPERRRDWYPYYAGFTERFVSDVLDLYSPDAKAVLDPWNGSGTTTVTCARKGLATAGVDINPALTVVARARLTPASVADSLYPLALRILSSSKPEANQLRATDPLTVWMQPAAASRIRAIQGAIHEAVSDLPPRAATLEPSELSEALPLLACFFYTCLFALARDILRNFRASNPTWIREPASHRHRLNPSWDLIKRLFLERVLYFSQRLSVQAQALTNGAPTLRTMSAHKLPFRTGHFDAVVTSPPYATRIDYVKSVLPELAILGSSSADVDFLRRVSTGSPVVQNVEPTSHLIASDYSLSLLKSIEKHPSKGSRSYYFPWMLNYLVSLQAGLIEIARVVSSQGTIAVVVQNSYYKNIPVDLQTIVMETLTSTGSRLFDRCDFRVAHHRALMNPKAKHYLADRNTKESLLVFRAPVP